jgi:hypothetical protein
MKAEEENKPRAQHEKESFMMLRVMRVFFSGLSVPS